MLSEISGRIFGSREILIVLITVNLIGFIAGIYYYLDEFAVSSPLLWIIIADCPLSVILFSVICYRYFAGKIVPDLLALFTSVYLIKYGIWTISAIILYWDLYVQAGEIILGSVNFLLHIGLVLEGIILLPKAGRNAYNTVIALSLCLLNDLSDYFLGTLSNIPPAHVQVLMIESIIVSIALPFSIFLIESFREGPKYRRARRVH